METHKSFLSLLGLQLKFVSFVRNSSEFSTELGKLLESGENQEKFSSNNLLDRKLY
jgi:hypothetical protein